MHSHAVMAPSGSRCDSATPCSPWRKTYIVDKTKSLDKFRVPIGNQEIELQEIEYAGGGMPMMRVRIRERSRFTIFDIDPLTAEHWARRMAEWAATQPR